MQGWSLGGGSTIDGVYYAHGRHLMAFPAVAAVYEGIHNFAPPQMQPQVAGWHRGYSDGHVVWTPAPDEILSPTTFWDVSWKYKHWAWAKWYW